MVSQRKFKTASRAWPQRRAGAWLRYMSSNVPSHSNEQHEASVHFSIAPKADTNSAQQDIATGDRKVPRRRPEQVQQTTRLFDDLVGAGKQLRWHLDAERLGGFQINYKLVLSWLLYRHVRRFSAPENSINVGR